MGSKHNPSKWWKDYNREVLEFEHNPRIRFSEPLFLGSSYTLNHFTVPLKDCVVSAPSFVMLEDKDAYPMLTLEGDPVPLTQELKLGEMYLMPHLFGYSKVTLEQFGDCIAGVSSGGLACVLDRGVKYWISNSSFNMRALDKLKFNDPTMDAWEPFIILK